jgi:RNA polymerase sigma factor (sigma-70 family)
VTGGEQVDLSDLSTPTTAARRIAPDVDIAVPDVPEILDGNKTDPRWDLAWSYRPLLLSMARSRVSWHEAEDVVSEALLRSQRADDVPDGALRSWLVTTTVHLCADVHRMSARDARRRQRLTGHLMLTEPGPEDDVADRDQARWLADQVQRLPGRQAEAVELRSDGYEVGSIAGRMGLPYKAVESLLSRARRSLKGWAAVAIGIWSFSRFVGRRTAQLHVAAAIGIAAASGAANVASPVVGAATVVSETGSRFHPLAPVEAPRPNSPGNAPSDAIPNETAGITLSL